MRARSLLRLGLLCVSGCGGRTPLEGPAPYEQAGTHDAGVVDAFADADHGAEMSDASDGALDGCFGAGIVAIASGESLPLDLAVDSTSVYWVESGPSGD